MEALTLSEAKALGLKRYFSGIECKHGHLSMRNVVGNYCIECNKNSVSKYKKRSGYSLPKEYFAAWRKNNKNKTIIYERNRCKAKLSERNAKKRAKMRLCTPSWIDDEDRKKIREIYDHAKDCTVSTGEKYEVDHIYPIMGEDVCGLHVPANLQVIPKYINRAKRNLNIGDAL